MNRRCFLALPVLVTATHAAEVTHREKVRRIDGEWLATPEGRDLRFEPPKFDHTRHIRLRLKGLSQQARVLLNRHPLIPVAGAFTEFDASDFLQAGKTNWLRVENSPAPQTLEWIETPRVFIFSQRVEREGAQIRASIWIRNTLENTATVTVTLSLDPDRGGTPVLVGDATVGPGVVQEVRLSGTARGTPVRAHTVLIKEAEAMEGGYRYEIWTTIIATNSQE